MRRTPAFVLAAMLTASAVQAQVDVRSIAQAVISAHARGASALPPEAIPDGTLRLLLETPGPLPPEAVWVAPGFAAWAVTPANLLASGLAQNVSVHWAPPRRPLLNRASAWVSAGQFRNVSGLRGEGVVVGIVDTGFDPKHADLRNQDGSTRVRWVLDLSRPKTGKHPTLESEYGCTSSGSPCAIHDATDLDALIASDSANLPRDAFGHGTHVASLAAGNGYSNKPAKYTGVAPDATFVIARVTRNDGGSIFDPDVVLATRFIFERAEAMGMPAVVNLSLGSDFGGHDGSAALERSLGELVGPDRPGRAIVVAAGNSAGVYTGVAPGYPPPFGIRTEVHVPKSSSVRVPILTPPVGKAKTRATIYIWIASRPGDALRIGVEDGDDEIVPPLGVGSAGSVSQSGVTATVLNQNSQNGSPIPPGTPGAIVVLDGSWDSGKTFALRLEGHGTASMWLQSEGDLAPGLTTGALFPRATKEGTIGIPASSGRLIAVGATLNRNAWTDRNDNAIVLQSFGSNQPIEDSVAYFSGLGPTATGLLKPDISAPGAFVIGAMSSLADPTSNGLTGMFAGIGTCGARVGCLVVDDHHAVTSGTSMASPIVAGALALLLERDPTLTQPALRALLQAGARRARGLVALPQQLGPGILDLMGTLSILESEQSPLVGAPTSEESWLTLASSFARPDPSWEIEGILQLRKQEGVIVDGFDPARLKLSVAGGALRTPLTRVAPGYWRFTLAAPSGSGGQRISLTVRFDNQVLLQQQVPIAVDPGALNGGARAQGGCQSSATSSNAAGGVVLLAWWLGFAWRRRDRRRG